MSGIQDFCPRYHKILFVKEDMDRFGDTFDPEIPFKGVDDGPYYRKGNYESQSRPHTAFAAMVTILDRQVGELMAELEKLGVADNTIVVNNIKSGRKVELYNLSEDPSETNDLSESFPFPGDK